MTRFFLLLFIGVLTFVILLLATNPDLFNDLWLYLIGLSGAIVKLYQVLKEKIETFVKDVTEQARPRPEDKQTVG